MEIWQPYKYVYTQKSDNSCPTEEKQASHRKNTDATSIALLYFVSEAGMLIYFLYLIHAVTSDSIRYVLVLRWPIDVGSTLTPDTHRDI